jgi:hypothetical protein
MTDDEKVRVATAKLLGEFYVGQRVRNITPTGKGLVGTVTGIAANPFNTVPLLTIAIDSSANDPGQWSGNSWAPL